MTYIELSGWVFNIIIALIALFLLWVFVIWPMVEGVSICRWYAAIGRRYPDVKPKNGWIKLWWSCTDIGGRNFESTRNKFGYWAGVGKWHVNTGEDQP